jgi:hypothetical protein
MFLGNFQIGFRLPKCWRSLWGSFQQANCAEVGSGDLWSNSAYSGDGKDGAGSLTQLVWIAEKSAILRSTNRFTLRCN